MSIKSDYHQYFWLPASLSLSDLWNWWHFKEEDICSFIEKLFFKIHNDLYIKYFLIFVQGAKDFNITVTDYEKQFIWNLSSIAKYGVL